MSAGGQHRMGDVVRADAPIDHLCGATSTRFPRDEIWVQYFRNIIFSFARNWGAYGRWVMLPLFCCAAFVKNPHCFLKAIRSVNLCYNKR